jgi:hypothetical protein
LEEVWLWVRQRLFSEHQFKWEKEKDFGYIEWRIANFW